MRAGVCGRLWERVCVREYVGMRLRVRIRAQLRVRIRVRLRVRLRVCVSTYLCASARARVCVYEGHL